MPAACESSARGLIGTALLALALALAACDGDTRRPKLAGALCHGEHTPITAVQGEHGVSPLIDTTTTVRGVITHIEDGRGFYLEDAGAPFTQAVSRAMFVASGSLARSVRSGQEISIRGRVAELGSKEDTLTALVDLATHEVCGESADLPITPLELPLELRAREHLEGMRIWLPSVASISDNYRAREGEWTVSAGDPLRQPTEDAAPGAGAAKQAARNRERSIRVQLPHPGSSPAAVGSTISRLQGVLAHDGRGQKLALESAPRLEGADAQVIDPPADGHVRVVSANLLNYFNGDGRGSGFPAARGPRSANEFREQQRRTQAAVAAMQPHLLGVQELENDGFGKYSAAQSLLDLLNTTGFATWAHIDPGTGLIGGDVITVGLFYRQDILEPLGSAELLTGSAFEGRSRVPIAQLFRVRATGAQFLVAVNHLKSKGRCPKEGPNADHNDGQGCWNRARQDAAAALIPWLDRLAKKYSTARTLIIGDMNAWRREDPIQAFRDGGYSELVEELSGLPQHSFLYFGKRGTLDYALASTAMRNAARKAFIWHINADWPRAIPLPEPWLRMSDHDPVVVDFDFSQAFASD